MNPMPFEQISTSIESHLPDGRKVYLRPIQPQDRQSLHQELFQKLSTESLRNRFLALKLDFTPDELKFMTEVDFLTHFALVAEIDCGSVRRLVGTGQFVRSHCDSNDAEIAITVVDEFQGKGIGRLMLQQLIECARELEVAQFTGSMFSQNTRMASLLRKTKLPYHASHHRGIASMSLDLN